MKMTNRVVRIPRPKPPETSVPSETLIPRSSMSATRDVPERKLKLDLIYRGGNTQRRV